MIMTVPITIMRSVTNNPQFSEPYYLDILKSFNRYINPMGININLYNGYTIGSLMHAELTEDKQSYILKILADTKYHDILARENCRVGTLCNRDEATNKLINIIGFNFYHMKDCIYDLDIIARAYVCPIDPITKKPI